MALGACVGRITLPAKTCAPSANAIIPRKMDCFSFINKVPAGRVRTLLISSYRQRKHKYLRLADGKGRVKLFTRTKDRKFAEAFGDGMVCK